MKLFITILLIVLSMDPSIQVELKDKNFYQLAFDYIVDDNCSFYANDKIDIKFEIGKEFIPFEIENIFENYLKQNHIKDYSVFDKTLTEKHKDLIDNVSDSLYHLNNELNLKCGKDGYFELNIGGKIKNKGFIIYFTKLCNQYLYAEVIPYNKDLIQDKIYSLLAQGEVTCYLFRFEKPDCISKSYKGIAHFD